MKLFLKTFVICAMVLAGLLALPTVFVAVMTALTPPIGTVCPTTGSPLQTALGRSIVANHHDMRREKLTPVVNAVVRSDGSAAAARSRAAAAGASCPPGGVESLGGKAYACRLEVTCHETAPYFISFDRTYVASFDLDDAGVSALVVESGPDDARSIHAEEGAFASRPYFRPPAPVRQAEEVVVTGPLSR